MDFSLTDTQINDLKKLNDFYNDIELYYLAYRLCLIGIKFIKQGVDKS